MESKSKKTNTNIKQKGTEFTDIESKTARRIGRKRRRHDRH